MNPLVDKDRVAAAALDPAEITRYARHLILPEVGLEGQQRLKAASVLLVGAGGLGSPLGLYLAAAGVGRLGLVDGDVVDLSNLQRQILHGTPDVGRPKVQSAADRIREVNPQTRLDLHATRLTAANALEIARDYDLLADGADNFPARYLVNDVCVLLGKPNVYGAVFRFEGQASVFAPCLGGPCYRCVHPEPPPPGAAPSCAEAGVLGVLPGLIGLVQATEVIKLILGRGAPLLGRLLIYDALGMTFREMKLRHNPRCPICGEKPSITHLKDEAPVCDLTPAPNNGSHSSNIMNSPVEISVLELKRRIEAKEDFDLVDVREPDEWRIAKIPGARLIPLGELPNRLGELDPAREIVLHCKMGGRSGRAVKFLQQKGFAKVENLTGGIDAWSQQVDPSVPRY